MRVELRESGGITIVDAYGNIRTSDDYSVFKETIENALADGKNKLALNFDGVNFINSSGLGRLALAAKKAQEDGGALAIFNLSDDLTELFSFTRLDVKIRVCSDEQEAIAVLTEH